MLNNSICKFFTIKALFQIPILQYQMLANFTHRINVLLNSSISVVDR